MLIKLFLAFALLQSAPTQISSNVAAMEIVEPQEERYIIVYKVNGATHAVIINHPVDCDAIRFGAEILGIQILDCGSEYGVPNGVIIPEGAKEVTEGTALSHFGISEWPE